MKVALVHDYIKEYGGAERVLEALHEMFPTAPIYTLVYAPKFLGPHRKRVEKWNIKTSFLQYIPFSHKFLGVYRLLAPGTFSLMDLSQYDVVIVSAAGTYTSPNFVKIGENTKLITYYHTPPRYLYGYATAGGWDRIWWKKILKHFSVIPLHILRILDFKAAQLPHIVLANSEEVRKRIKHFYKRDAIVINPPVDVTPPKNMKKVSKQDYFLTGGRLARAKHNEIPILACTELGIKLKVFGKDFSGYMEELKQIAGNTIEFVGEVSDEQRWKIMSEARAFLYASEDEDFGIIPVESMAAGTPVIAHKSGGVQETVIDGKTGVFYKELSVEGMKKAITSFEKLTFSSLECRKRAEHFKKERFVSQIQDLL